MLSLQNSFKIIRTLGFDLSKRVVFRLLEFYQKPDLQKNSSTSLGTYIFRINFVSFWTFKGPYFINKKLVKKFCVCAVFWNGSSFDLSKKVAFLYPGPFSWFFSQFDSENHNNCLGASGFKQRILARAKYFFTSFWLARFMIWHTDTRNWPYFVCK